jgi:hypothetical protein
MLPTRHHSFEVLDFDDVRGNTAIDGNKRNLANTYHPSIAGYLMRRYNVEIAANDFEVQNNPAMLHPTFFGYAKNHQIDVATIMHQSRQFNLDLNCKLIFSSGAVVDSLVHSGVANYVEFKAIEKVFYMIDEKTKENEQFQLYEVPCSKGDFNTSLFHFNCQILNEVLVKSYSPT